MLGLADKNIKMGFPGGSVVKNLLANAGDLSFSLRWEDPQRRKWQPTPVFLPGKSHGQRSLVGYSPWGCKESDTTERVGIHTHTHTNTHTHTTHTC